MSEMKKYLIFWSGGLDSTYLLNWSLQRDAEIHACYIDIVNNAEKRKRELLAIEKMLPYFSKFKNFKYLGSAMEVNLKLAQNSMVDLDYVPIIISAAIFSGLGYEEISCAYVMNDDAISYLNEIREIYKSYEKISTCEFPPLTFPMSKVDKPAIIKELPEELFKEITFCENGENKDNCGICTPCRRWKTLEESGKVPKEFIRFNKKKSSSKPRKTKAKAK